MPPPILGGLLAASLLWGVPNGVLAATAANPVTKDVVIYLDVSNTTTKADREHHSYFFQFATVLSDLFNADRHFLYEGDSLTIVCFADKTYQYRPFSPWQPDQQHDLNILLTNLTSDTTAEVWRKAGLKTSITNLDAVFDHITRSLKPNRQQIFLIASDLAHDPANQPCGNIETRKASIQAIVQRFRKHLESRHDTARPRIALLKADSSTQCKGDREVGDFAESNIKLMLEGQSLPISRSSGAPDVDELLSSIARAPTLTLDNDSALGPGPDGLIQASVTNTNAFDIATGPAKFIYPDDRVIVQDLLQVRVQAGGSQRISIPVPAAVDRLDAIHLALATSYGDTSLVSFPSQGIVASDARAQVYKWLLPDHATTLLSLRARVKIVGANKLTATIGKLPPQEYDIADIDRLVTLVLPIDTSREQATDIETAPKVSLELTNAKVFTAPNPADISAARTLPVSVQSPLKYVPDSAQLGTVFAFVVWGARRLAQRKTRFFSDLVTSYHHLRGGADILATIAAPIFAFAIPFAHFIPLPYVGSLNWSWYFMGFFVACLTLSITYLLVLNGLWSWFEPAEGGLLPAARACAIRRNLTILICVVSALAGVAAVLLLWPSIPGDAVILTHTVPR